MGKEIVSHPEDIRLDHADNSLNFCFTVKKKFRAHVVFNFKTNLNIVFIFHLKFDFS